MKELRLKRVYDEADKKDGFRILVDRIWPRGISKQKAKIGAWLKDVAPSTQLRKWFNHDPKKWNEFVKRYREELKETKELSLLKDIISKHEMVTFVYAAKDEKYNNAVALKMILKL